MCKWVREGVSVCCNACVSICLFSPTNKSFFSLNLSTQNRWHIRFNVKDIRYTIYCSFFDEITHIQAVSFCVLLFSLYAILWNELEYNCLKLNCVVKWDQKDEDGINLALHAKRTAVKHTNIAFNRRRHF